MRRNRPGRRIELLNARWHGQRQSPGFGSCAVCGRDLSETVRAVYSDGKVFHGHCVRRRSRPT